MDIVKELRERLSCVYKKAHETIVCSLRYFDSKGRSLSVSVEDVSEENFFDSLCSKVASLEKEGGLILDLLSFAVRDDSYTSLDKEDRPLRASLFKRF